MVKVKSTRRIPKFSSKYVGKLLDEIISEKVKSVKKNPKTTAKWLGKLQTNIQKNISKASKIAFAPNGMTKEALIENIKSTEKAIAEKCEKLKQLVKSQMKLSQGWPAASDLEKAKPPSRFEKSIADLSSKIRHVAENLADTKSDLEKKSANLHSTVTVIENWKAAQQESRLTSAAHIATSEDLSAGGSGLADISDDETESTAMLKSLIDHLS